MAVPMFLAAGAIALLIPNAGITPVRAVWRHGPAFGTKSPYSSRQRRTDPAWMGRAFAISMSFNFAGYPIGAAIGGFVAAQSIELALGLAVVATLLSAAFARWQIPAHEADA
jgi:hypothetical protein